MKSSKLLPIILSVSLLMGGCSSLIDPLDNQIATSNAMKVLSVQGYAINGDSEEALLRKRWENLSDLMRAKPGFVLARLGEGSGKSSFWLAYSEWESVEAIRRAFSDQAVLNAEEQMPKRLFGHLYERRAQAIP